MNNRHDRRAKEAQARKSFEEYASAYRKAFRKADDREIGEGWMRGAKAEADDIQGMVIHPPGETRPAASACDIFLSVAYGTLRFDAVTRSEYLPTMQAEWPKIIEQLREKGIIESLDVDPRRDARSFIVSALVANMHYENGTAAAMMASAIVWLIKGSPVGVALGASHKGAHYEITDTGPGQQNFRLMLM